jgi:Bacterial pre-peptidase C-terminal domain
MKKILAMVAAALVSACGGSSKDGGAPNTNPGEPNNTIAQATQVTPGTPILGTISTDADVDVHKFTVPAGGATVHIQTFDQGGVDCDTTNESVDTKIVVYDGAGTKVAESDDSGLIWCEDLDVTLGAGTNYVEVGGWQPIPFVYMLKVSIR